MPACAGMSGDQDRSIFDHAPALPRAHGRGWLRRSSPDRAGRATLYIRDHIMTARRSRLRTGPRHRVRRRGVRRPVIEADLDEDEDVEIGAGDPDRESGSPANRA
jgi:hypothetical protein